jgi:hypothetical protein
LIDIFLNISASRTPARHPPVAEDREAHMSTIAPDGRVLTIAGNPHGLVGPWLFMMWVTRNGTRFRLHAGARGGQEAVLLNSGRYGQVKVREAGQGRTRLVSLEDVTQGGTTLVWQGDFHEVSTFVHGTDVPLESFPALLAPLEISDARDGIVVRARPGTGTAVEYVLGGNFIPDLASLTVKPLAAATQEVPHAGGKAVRGGRLWRSDDHAADGSLSRRTLILANRSTASFLVPFDPAAAALAPLAESLTVTLS